MWTLPVIETKRLILRPITLVDAPAIFEYASNPNVSRYVLWNPHRTIADSEAFVKKYAFANYQKEIPEPWGVTVKENGNKVVGTVGCRWASQNWKSMDLGYLLAETLWGKGIAAEAARAAIGWIYANYDVNRIQARCQVPNVGSARVMEKLGMTREGVLRASEFKEGQFIDMYYYSILRSEWERCGT